MGAPEAVSLSDIPYLPEVRTGWEEPIVFDHISQAQGCLFEMLAHGVSDIYIQTGRPVLFEKRGQLTAATRRKLSGEEAKRWLEWLADDAGAGASLAKGEEIACSFVLSDPERKDVTKAPLKHRYRINATRIYFRGSWGIQVVIRYIPPEIPVVQFEDELTDFSYRPGYVALPRDLVDAFTNLKDGIGLFSGPTGSGKSTSLAAINRYIIEGDTAIHGNIVTLEAPIEFNLELLVSRHSIVAQSEVGKDILSFADGVRGCMRRHPALIYVGEIRDYETASAAVEAAQTGHPVIATVHANDCDAIIPRLVSRFPENLRSTALFDIAFTTRVLVNQELARCPDGRQTALRSYLIMTDSMQKDISSMRDPSQIAPLVKEMMRGHGVTKGMAAQTAFDRGLIDEWTLEKYLMREKL